MRPPSDHDAPSIEHPGPYGEGARTPIAHGGASMAAGRVLIVIAVASLAWTFLLAPTLERASQAQPLGARRTVSLWVLRPIAAISDFLQLTSATDAASRALGRDPNEAPGGGVDVPPPQDIPTVPSASPRPSTPVVKDTKIRRPTPTNELRIVVVGDSLAAGLGLYLEREFRPALVQVLRQGRVSTGLSRLDYFNWMQGMRDIEARYQPDLVVVMIGDNDNQNLLTPTEEVVAEIGSFEWAQKYEDRVEEFTRIAVDGGSHVAWVGLPIVQRKERWDVMQRQNESFERVVDSTPNALYVDTWDRFATQDGQYTPFYWEDGKVELIRTSDGLHFNPRGYELLAEAVGAAVVDQFRLTPSALAE